MRCIYNLCLPSLYENFRPQMIEKNQIENLLRAIAFCLNILDAIILGFSHHRQPFAFPFENVISGTVAVVFPFSLIFLRRYYRRSCFVPYAPTYPIQTPETVRKRNSIIYQMKSEIRTYENFEHKIIENVKRKKKLYDKGIKMKINIYSVCCCEV